MPLSHHQGSHRALLWALGLSLVFHAGLLSLKWAAPDTFDRIFETNTLEVVLVNSSSKNVPDSPLALAQVNLAGGGQVPGTSLQTSPFSAPKANANTQELEQLEQQIQSLKNEEQRLIQQLRQALFQLNSPDQPQVSEAKAASSARPQKRFHLRAITTKCAAPSKSQALKIFRKQRDKNSTVNSPWSSPWTSRATF